MSTIFAEYIWTDGTKPTALMRSKTRICNYSGILSLNPNDYPEWGYDGSSTGQADGNDSDLVLKPVFVAKDPIRRNGSVLVLCEVFHPDGVTPHSTNTRAKLREVLEQGGAAEDSLWGFEQEYCMMREGRLIGWPQQPKSYPRPQGPYYCGVGADEVAGRELYEAHMRACVDAELLIYGTNFEVMLGQAEFQIGYRGRNFGDTPAGPLTTSDHLWVARWLLHRIGENYKINTTLDPKPVSGDWNGSGMHTNVSTAATRADGGLQEIFAICAKLETKHADHIERYGAGNERRLLGSHETCDINTFKSGTRDRTASIRIPSAVAEDKKGYLEDRRPASNADPYVVCATILRTVCDLW